MREFTLNFVTSANLPFSIVENEDFIKFASYISTDKAAVPSRKTLIKDLAAQSDSIKREIIKIINQHDYICTTADVLTTRAKSYLGVTIHYFDENLEKQSYMLAFRRLRGRHTHDKLADAILAIHREFNLKRSKITHIVTDGGSNFCKAFRKFGEAKNPEKIDDESIDPVNTSDDDDEIDIDIILGPVSNESNESNELNEPFVENMIAETIEFQSDDNSNYFDEFETLPKIT